MSDQDRGPYTPVADRLAFDPREPVRSGPAPVTLIASALILVGLVGGVAFIYRHGLRQPGAAPAEVGAPVGEIKSAAPPEPSSGAAAGLSVDKSGPPTFAPPPEQPLPRTSPGSDGGPQAIAAAAPPPAPPVAAQPAAPPAAAAAAKPVTIDSLADAAVAGKPAAKPAAHPLAKSAAMAAAPVTGGNWVQIGAFSSPALADKGWSDAARLAPADMGGKGKKVEAVVSNGKTLYRAYVTGFSTHAVAESFCGDLKAAGRSCFVK